MGKSVLVFFASYSLQGPGFKPTCISTLTSFPFSFPCTLLLRPTGLQRLPRHHSHVFSCLSFTHMYSLCLEGLFSSLPLANSWVPCLCVQPHRTSCYTIMPTLAPCFCLQKVYWQPKWENFPNTDLVYWLLKNFSLAVTILHIKKPDRMLTLWKKNSGSSNNLFSSKADKGGPISGGPPGSGIPCFFVHVPRSSHFILQRASSPSLSQTSLMLSWNRPREKLQGRVKNEEESC